MCDDCCVAGFFSLKETMETLILLVFTSLKGYGFNGGRVRWNYEVEALLWKAY